MNRSVIPVLGFYKATAYIGLILNIAKCVGAMTSTLCDRADINFIT